MAVQNPFDAQPQKPRGLVADAMQPAAYAPATRSVDERQTVRGQVDSILAGDGPLMQRARSIALEQMSARGLVNSSLAVGAAQGAMMDRALPIAQQDANTYDQAERDNQGLINRASEFNAGEQNRFGLQRGEQEFAAGQADVGRRFQTSERQGAQQFQAEQTGQQQRFASGERVAGERFQAGQLGEQQRFQSGEREAGERFAGAQQQQQNEQQLRVLAQQQANQLEQLGYQSRLATAQVPAAFAAGVSQSTMERVNQIMGDPNLDAAAKKSAVDNVVNYANATLSWAEKFYGAAVPRLNTPQPPAAPATPATVPREPSMQPWRYDGTAGA